LPQIATGPDIYEVEGEKGTWVCRIWLTADGKVERVIAQPANAGSNAPPVTQNAVAGDASYAEAAAADTRNASAASAEAAQAASRFLLFLRTGVFPLETSERAEAAYYAGGSPNESYCVCSKR